jgi:hypothetical protein
MVASAPAINPRQYFFFAEAPVLAQAKSGQALQRAPARPSIDPGDGYLQQLGYFLDSEEGAVASLLPSCGRVG